MIERVIENWLDKASEKSFQKPFCHMLAAEGYTVLHLTRHCPMEMGKDVIAINPDGKPCAFQLKKAIRGRISLSHWRNDINPQIDALVTGRIRHPSITTGGHHLAYLVTNGELDEEVCREIGDKNSGWAATGLSQFKLQTIVRGEILNKINAIKTSMWYFEEKDERTFIELYHEDGKGTLPKVKLSSLFESMIHLGFKGEKRPSTQECTRILSSAALLCSVVTSKYYEGKNYFAEIEAWTMLIASVFAFVTKWNLPASICKDELEIAKTYIYNRLEQIYIELKGRSYLVEGDALVDQPFYRIRVTSLVALMSVYGLWRKADGLYDEEVDDFISQFCLMNKDKLQLWGEAAIPQFLAFFWYFRTVNSTKEPTDILGDLIKHICMLNNPRGIHFLANPYYEAEDILPYIIPGLITKAEEPLDDHFQGHSYALEGLVHLFVRRNYKQTMKFLWPNVTRLAISLFEMERKWHFFRWRNETGSHKTILVQPTQKWEDLRKIALESEGKCIPQIIKDDPIILLLFLIVYPHRINSDVLRWLDSRLTVI